MKIAMTIYIVLSTILQFFLSYGTLHAGIEENYKAETLLGLFFIFLGCFGVVLATLIFAR